MTKRIIILAAISLFIFAMAVPGLAQSQDRKMEYEAYLAEMEQWQQREANAQAELEDCESSKDALRAEIDDLETQIAGVWDEIYDMLGITESDVDAFAKMLDDFERDLNAFGRLTPEQMYQRQADLDELEMRLHELAKDPAALLTRFMNRINKYQSDIDRYRSRMAGPRNIKYTVMRGDHLWGIASMPKHYGDGAKWMRIYSVNREMIDDPDLIYPQQVFTVPMEIDKRSQYLVQRGDYLARISENVYGDPFQWRKIYEANRDLIPDQNLIYTNTILSIPGR